MGYSGFTHPGRHVTVTFGNSEVVAHDWQGNTMFTCCRGRAACGSHTNYLPVVEQAARIANGPAVWLVGAVDERERTVDLTTVRDSGETEYRVIGFENLTIVSPDDYVRDMRTAEARKIARGGQ
jgi:hypothetical protein